MKFNLLATTAWWKEGPAPVARALESSEQKTVFIIEDNPESLRAMRLAAGGEDYRMETVCSAESAIGRLSGSPPDLILLNTEVLDTEGIPLVRRLLADESLVSVPIVALTAMGAGGRMNPEAGSRFDGQIGKPIDPQTFPSEVRTLLDSLSQPSARSADLILPEIPAGDKWRQVASLLDTIEAGLPDSQFCSDTQPSLRRLAEAIGDAEHADVADYLQQAERLSKAATARGRSRFRSVVRHCRELVDREPDVTPGLPELCAGYLDRRRAELSVLAQSLKNGDFKALAKAGHNLKGTGAAYGFSELTDIGRALEAAAKDADAAAIEDVLNQLDSYIGMVRPSPD
jgi:CheY-like chemotaxis protein